MNDPRAWFGELLDFARFREDLRRKGIYTQTIRVEQDHGIEDEEIHDDTICRPSERLPGISDSRAIGRGS